MLGIRRLLHRSEEERLDWMPVPQQNQQPHDASEQTIRQCNNYFTPARYYCVETICAPCGVVIAWAKFAKSESPTKILDFLQNVYPNQDQ